MNAPSSPTFGLPKSLWVPIAAASEQAIENFVGKILAKRQGQGRINAVLVETCIPDGLNDPQVPLWTHPKARLYRERLWPAKQVWVHVDYTGYRDAYKSFGMPAIPSDNFLDHVQNRRAVRMRGRSHPFLRLCPVARAVNTSGGHSAGGEGMEKEFLTTLKKGPPAAWAEFLKSLGYPIVYADPMDLTKMLDIRPGTVALEGVGQTQSLFYNPNK